MKVVISQCYGGFGLSDEAYQWLIDNKGWTSSEYNKKGGLIDETAKIHISGKEDAIGGKYHCSWYGDEDRTNPDLIEVVETLGKRANTRYSKLNIIDIPDGVEFEIDEYDGFESIHETHRTWG